MGTKDLLLVMAGSGQANLIHHEDQLQSDIALLLLLHNYVPLTV